MSAIELITKLREMTGAGIKDCNNALKEANNNIETAVKILREKGIASAVKRADRVAKQGVVVAQLSEDKKQGLIRVNARSRGPAINKVLEKYNGGGHKYASGARIKDEKDIDNIIKDLDELVKEYKKDIEK